MARKTIRVDACEKISAVVETLCQKQRVNKPHRFELVTSAGDVLSDHSTLSDCGLGVKFRSYQVRVAYKQFPVGTNYHQGEPTSARMTLMPAADTMVVRALLEMVFDQAWQTVQDRKRAEAQAFCRQLVQIAIEESLTRIDKALALPVRIASLSAASRKDFYKFLRQKEREDHNRFS